jgi:hypothetical protein
VTAAEVRRIAVAAARVVDNAPPLTDRQVALLRAAGLRPRGIEVEEAAA